jgi:hypothetical protein
MTNYTHQQKYDAAKDLFSRFNMIAAEELIGHLIQAHPDQWYEALDQADEPEEIFQYYMIDSDAAYWLREVGALVVEFYGSNIFCRTSFGQSLWADEEFQAIGEVWLNNQAAA